MQRSFPRRIDALPALVQFAHAALESAALDAAQRHAVDFTIEELFTNMVKYAKEGAAEIAVDIITVEGGAQVTLIDTGVDRFDVTRAPDAAVDLPLEQRQPGGLGLHVLRRLVDAIEYDYDPVHRVGRTQFIVGGPSGRAHHAVG